MRALRVNETKLTSGNAFIVDLFALGGEKKNQNMTKELFLGGSLRNLELFLNP